MLGNVRFFLELKWVTPERRRSVFEPDEGKHPRNRRATGGEIPSL